MEVVRDPNESIFGVSSDRGAVEPDWRVYRVVRDCALRSICGHQNLNLSALDKAWIRLRKDPERFGVGSIAIVWCKLIGCARPRQGSS